MPFDFGRGVSGALTGGATGSMFGPIGTAVGAGLGLFGGFGKKGSSKKEDRLKKISTLDPTQTGIYDEYAKSVLGKGGAFDDAFGFDPEGLRDVYQQNFATPAYQDFQEEIVPGITGAFRGKNLQNSTYLGGALGKAGTRVQQDLNAKMSGMLYNAQQAGVDRRLDAVKQILNMQTFAIDRPQEKSDPFWDMIGGFAPKAFDFLLNKFGNSGGGGGGYGNSGYGNGSGGYGQYGR